MQLSEYVQYINTISENREKRLMACLALHLYIDREQYPINMHVVETLPDDKKLIACAFIGNCLSNGRKRQKEGLSPDEYMSLLNHYKT